MNGNRGSDPNPTLKGFILYPVNCVSWFVGFAFCAWDGGRLPTEAEWEFAAAGGSDNRIFPWGDALDSPDQANYIGSGEGIYLDVFAKPAGAGKWGHEGLAGSLWEWTMDVYDGSWYLSEGSDCLDCVNWGLSGARTMRGGAFDYDETRLRAAHRQAGTAGTSWYGNGLRCARD